MIAVHQLIEPNVLSDCINPSKLKILHFIIGKGKHFKRIHTRMGFIKTPQIFKVYLIIRKDTPESLLLHGTFLKRDRSIFHSFCLIFRICQNRFKSGIGVLIFTGLSPVIKLGDQPLCSEVFTDAFADLL